MVETIKLSFNPAVLNNNYIAIHRYPRIINCGFMVSVNMSQIKFGGNQIMSVDTPILSVIILTQMARWAMLDYLTE